MAGTCNGIGARRVIKSWGEKEKERAKEREREGGRQAACRDSRGPRLSLGGGGLLRWCRGREAATTRRNATRASESIEKSKRERMEGARGWEKRESERKK